MPFIKAEDLTVRIKLLYNRQALQEKSRGVSIEAQVKLYGELAELAEGARLEIV